ncbi:MAG: hypothetical protein ACYTAS_10655 [Planctomycetota bacterium]|jgi:hypothetical protein
MSANKRSLIALALAVVAMAILGLTTNPANAGTISYVRITGDADCGISADNTYTHKLDFGTGSPGALINGVQFDAYNATANGTLNFSREAATGLLSDHGGNANHNVSGDLVDLLTDMYYNGNNAVDGTTAWTLSGLTAGQSYRTRIYTRQWGASDSRLAIFVFDPDGEGPVSDATEKINQDDATSVGFTSANDAYYIDYEFTAVAGEDLVITLTQDNYNMSWHLYGLTNQEYSPQTASVPYPADGATDVLRDADLGWSPGVYAATHDVYVGESFEAVDAATVPTASGLEVTSFDPGRLELGKTYFWRVDEASAAPDSTVFKGDIWSFTVEPLAYPIQGVIASTNAPPQPGAGVENTVNGSGLNELDQHSVESSDMWLGIPGADPIYLQYEFDGIYKLHEMLVWNYNVQFELVLGFGIKNATIEYSINGTEWTALGDFDFAQATATATYTANTTVDFGGVAAKYVRLTINSGQGMMGQYGLSEVRLMYIPAVAREPEPANGAVDIAVDADLSWRAGREAVSHEVYLSPDPNALELVDTTGATTADPGALELAAIYYWRVDEVNEAEAISTWEGAVWSFSTEAYLVVEDFESYDDEDNRIYDAWTDGFVNDTGSTVGHFESPFAEQTIVHGGKQSMPLFYDNMTAAYSEATTNAANLRVGQDWTKHGIKALTLYFHGDPDNSAEQMYVKLNGSKIMYDGDVDDLTQTLWRPWHIDLQDSEADLSSVTELGIGFERIGIAGGKGVVYFDDIRLYPMVSVAGTFSIHAWTGDQDSGISSDKIYTHTGKFSGEGNDGEPFLAGNGVYFERDTDNSGTNWTLTGPATNIFDTTNPVNVTGDGAALVRGFFYGDQGDNHPVLTLMNLVPGTTYVATFYTVGYGGAGGRFVDITPSDNSRHPTRVDQNGAGSGNGQLIKYTYIATSTEMSFVFDALVTGDSWHHYAFSNEVANPN